MTRKEIDETLLRAHSPELREVFRRSRKELRQKARREWKEKNLNATPPNRAGPG
jgi:hypothetical protein